MAEGQPGVDKRQYARETAQAIQGLARLLPDPTGEQSALTPVRRAPPTGRCTSAPAERRLPPPERDSGGPYLADNVEMAAARCWPCIARPATASGSPPRDDRRTSSPATFVDAGTGGFFAVGLAGRRAPPQPIKRARTMSRRRALPPARGLLRRPRHREIAEAGMGYLRLAGRARGLRLPARRAARRGGASQRAGACDHRRPQGPTAQRPRSTRRRPPIRSPTSAPNGGTSAKASSPIIDVATIRTIPTAPPLRPHAATPLAARHRLRGDPGQLDRLQRAIADVNSAILGG